MATSKQCKGGVDIRDHAATVRTSPAVLLFRVAAGARIDRVGKSFVIASRSTKLDLGEPDVSFCVEGEHEATVRSGECRWTAGAQRACVFVKTLFAVTGDKITCPSHLCTTRVRR